MTEAKLNGGEAGGQYGIHDTASGNDIATKGRFRYTGQMWIPELGMYYYKARIYSPTLGRLLQTDPIGYEDQVNLYAYVGNDPINGVDPTGMTQTTCPAEGECTTIETPEGEENSIEVTVPDDTDSDRSRDSGGFIIQLWGDGPPRRHPRTFPLPLTDIPERAQTNGCGSDNANVGRVFEACDFHDICWTTFGESRSRCDAQFLIRMLRECHDGEPRCIVGAATFYVIVAGPAGKAAWEGAQTEASIRKFYTGRDN